MCGLSTDVHEVTARYHDDSPSNLIEYDVISMSSDGSSLAKVSMRASSVCTSMQRGSRGEESVPRASRTHATTARGQRVPVGHTHSNDLYRGYAAFTQRSKYLYALSRSGSRSLLYGSIVIIASDANERCSWRRVATFLQRWNYQSDRNDQ